MIQQHIFLQQQYVMTTCCAVCHGILCGIGFQGYQCNSKLLLTLLFLKWSAQVQYGYNTTAILQLYCTCMDPYNTTLQYKFLQLAENLQATCSSCKKTCIAVVLRLCSYFCRLLKYNKIFVLCYCSCIVVVLHLCGLL